MLRCCFSPGEITGKNGIVQHPAQKLFDVPEWRNIPYSRTPPAKYCVVSNCGIIKSIPAIVHDMVKSLTLKCMRKG